MKHVIQYTKYATYHIEAVRNLYSSFIKSLKFPENGPFSVMDIGCGSGRMIQEVLYPLIPENCSELVATDADTSMIEYCQSLKMDQKISFEQLDITTKELSAKFKNRFHFLFSTYCFHHVLDLKQGLINCNSMLRPNGELLFIFICKHNHLYTTYRRMSEIDMWYPYTSKFKNFLPHFYGPDPDGQLKTKFAEAGLKVAGYSFKDDLSMISSTRQVLELYGAMDSVYRRIPEDIRDHYVKDFRRIFSEITKFDFVDEQKLVDNIDMPIPTLIVHGQKPQLEEQIYE